MKFCVCILLVLSIACGGKLTDEQRKKLKEGMKRNEIRRVSDAQITEAAFTLGRTIIKSIEETGLGNRKGIDSLRQLYHIRIFPLHPGDTQLLEIEKRIVEAYISGSGHVQLSDNVQRMGPDSVLYTQPVMKELPDGSMRFSYAMGIHIPRKEVVLSIKD